MLAVTLSPASWAASGVTLYGTFDIYFDATHQTGGELLRIDSSGQLPSNIGLKAEEELAPGTQLTAQVESAFNPDGTPMSSPPFDRLHFISIDNPLGEFTVGKQFTPQFFQLGLHFDPFQTSYWGSAYAIFEGGDRYARIPNTVSYDSPDLLGGHASFSVLYSSSDPNAGDVGNRPQWYFSAAFKPIKGLFIGYSSVRDHRYSELNPDTRLDLFGIAWKVADIEFSAAGQMLKLRETSQRYQESVYGARGSVGGVADWSVTYARTRLTPGAGQWASVVGLALAHDVSKNLSVYTSAARLVNGSAYDLDFGTNNLPGHKSFDQMLGMRLRF